METRAAGPHVAVSIDDVRTVPAEEAYNTLIHEAAATYRLDPALIRAVMQTESAFNALVVSPVGAEGLMQLMPPLAKEMGVSDSFDPRQNIMAGARYLRELLDRHRGNLPLALASYNAGPAAVDKYHAVPPFRETERYVKAITALIKRGHEEEGN
jgi:soluble lytic murein transglycosylase-like protein